MTMMTTDLAAARRALAGIPVNALCAVSGGLDSMCLLHLLHAEGFQVTAAHFNHRLRQTADRDEGFVRDWCAERNIPFLRGEGDVRGYAVEAGKTLEEAGRELRYAFLERSRREAGCAVILTAHHADDNAETLLLNLLRGTGLQGLTGIPAERDHILRPFLGVTRAQLAEYAREHHVPHVEDETNEEDDAARNLLRHRVLPVLREINPRAVENMNRTAGLLAQDARALEMAAGDLLREAEIVPGERAVLPLSACEKRPKAVVNRAALGLLVSVGGHRKDLTAGHVESLLALRAMEAGKTLSLPYGMTARREKDTIIIVRNTPAPEETSIAPGEKAVFGGWTVELRETPQPGSLPVPKGDYTVTRWRAADRMTLPGTRGKRSLKRLWAERGVAPEVRDTIPVLRMGETPVAVAGLGVDLDVTPRREDAVLYVTFTNYKTEGERL